MEWEISPQVRELFCQCKNRPFQRYGPSTTGTGTGTGTVPVHLQLENHSSQI
jgi:hypothetical protein